MDKCFTVSELLEANPHNKFIFNACLAGSYTSCKEFLIQGIVATTATAANKSWSGGINRTVSESARGALSRVSTSATTMWTKQRRFPIIIVKSWFVSVARTCSWAIRRFIGAWTTAKPRIKTKASWTKIERNGLRFCKFSKVCSQLHSICRWKCTSSAISQRRKQFLILTQWRKLSKNWHKSLD